MYTYAMAARSETDCSRWWGVSRIWCTKLHETFCRT